VVSSWRVEGGRFQLEVTVPVNAQATIRFPSGATPDQVREGDRPLSESTEVRILPRQGEGVVVRVGSGTYRFSAPWSEAPVR
jgi:alpha-L-rhamnosidase